MADTEWLTVPQVAAILGVSEGRVRQLISRDQIRSTLHGHVRLIKRKDAESYEPMTGKQGGRPVGYRFPLYKRKRRGRPKPRGPQVSTYVPKPKPTGRGRPPKRREQSERNVGRRGQPLAGVEIPEKPPREPVHL